MKLPECTWELQLRTWSSQAEREVLFDLTLYFGGTVSFFPVFFFRHNMGFRGRFPIQFYLSVIEQEPSIFKTIIGLRPEIAISRAFCSCN